MERSEGEVEGWGGGTSSLLLIMEEDISQAHVAPPCQSVPSLGTRLIIIISAHPLNCRFLTSCDVGFPQKPTWNETDGGAESWLDAIVGEPEGS